MKYSKSNKPLQCFMTQSTCYRRTRKMVPKGILWHSTGANNPALSRYVQPDDRASNRTQLINLIGVNKYRNDWNHIEVQAGVNAWIGKLANGDVATIQVMPWDFRPWGCGSGRKGSCNDGWIQFEICEDDLTNPTYFEQVYNEACELTAYLCELYKIDPNGIVLKNGVKVPTILCHADSYKLGFGSNHRDVLHWFSKHNKTMTNVRADVAALLKSSTISQFKPYKVKITTDALNIREKPTTQSKIVGTIKDKGVYTIVGESSGTGASKWGKLKSGAGWISLDYTKKL